MANRILTTAGEITLKSCLVAEMGLQAATVLSAGTAAGLSALATAAFVMDKITSIFTLGNFRIIHIQAFILRSDIIWPRLIKIIRYSAITSVVSAVLLAFVVAIKCLTATLLGKRINWKNWQF